jgi:hypothetical protein
LNSAYVTWKAKASQTIQINIQDADETHESLVWPFIATSLQRDTRLAVRRVDNLKKELELVTGH